MYKNCLIRFPLKQFNWGFFHYLLWPVPLNGLMRGHIFNSLSSEHPALYRKWALRGLDTHRGVTCCCEWAFGRSFWGWAPPPSELGTSGEVWLSFRVPKGGIKIIMISDDSQVSFVIPLVLTLIEAMLFGNAGLAASIRLIDLTEWFKSTTEEEEEERGKDN